MRFIYSILWYLISPYLLLRLWWKGRQLPSYRKRIGERFGRGMSGVETFDVWIHAVSLGEVIAATPLIEQLAALQRRILVTTMTPTGAERVQRQFADRVVHRYIPYEFPGAMRRFFQTYQLRTGIIFETELWPNLIHYATQARVPLYLFNARLSEKSLQGYRKIRCIIKPMLRSFKAIYTQAREDAQRFKMLGAQENQVTTLGNIKFDLQTKVCARDEFDHLKRTWGEDRIVVIIASTHDNEEQQILMRLPSLQKAIPHVLLLIAPRHPERFDKVVRLSREMGFNTGQRSQPDTLNSDNDVIVIDTLGELLACYQISDYAFVGGSLLPIGGHNMLEPVAMHVPVFSGRYVHNFKAIVRDLEEAEAIILVNDAQELLSGIVALHQDREKRNRLVNNASHVLEINKGAVARYVEIVESALANGQG
ncbi:lipid IV(A) 3-deoxy-D-manno-octulosonic acid transferase [Legionella spiritensis]|uniref:lipid IV(A) 3-deoxy-D-manno-octulosonic acid transferase n=1 Tax=Legionella spiritensis TaxID=452 RepID=UPI000F6D7B43|nr:lipid IV(A) 3-deoxy-D-manno-octulosonic acid transferase [Legionella spiritensis]VEG90763.1 3-deoxy-D-manno-oct-2-ulosonic acid transferase [Legionella spiritensis]